jgi:hypothetical protein
MGLKPDEVERCTLGQFNLMLLGYQRRQEKEWDRTRHIMAFILNYAGFGAKEFHHPKDIFPLHMDNEDKKKRINSIKQAYALLKEFE